MPPVGCCIDTLDSQESQLEVCSEVMLILQHFLLVMGMATMAYNGWGWGRGNPSVTDADTGLALLHSLKHTERLTSITEQ